MSKLPAIFFVATLLLAPRLAAADVPPSDMPADCSVASLNVPDGVKCVECVIQGSMRPECASDWAKQGYEGDFMSGDPASVGYAYMACTQSGSGPKVFTYQVWCDADLSTSGGCATRSPGRGFDAGIVGLLLATAAYVGWARRRRGSTSTRGRRPSPAPASTPRPSCSWDRRSSSTAPASSAGPAPVPRISDVDPGTAEEEGETPWLDAVGRASLGEAEHELLPEIGEREEEEEDG